VKHDESKSNACVIACQTDWLMLLLLAAGGGPDPPLTAAAEVETVAPLLDNACSG
jgi:hypothetical protein